jgi:hypothetical protein
VTDDADRLALFEELAHECNGVLVHPHRVRVADAAGDHERAVVVGARLV